MLGIIIGIAAIIAIVSTIEGTRDQIRNNMIGSGTVDVRLKLGSSDYSTDYYGDDGSINAPVLTEQDRKDIEKIEHVSQAGLYREKNIETAYDSFKVFYNDASPASVHLVGVDSHFLDINGYVVAEGRHFSQNDFDHYRKVCMINFTTASQLFQDIDPIGKVVDIGEEPFTVIGVYTPATESNVVITSPDDYVKYGSAEQKRTEILIPGSCWQMIVGYDQPQNVIVRPDSTEHISSVANEVSNMLNDKYFGKSRKSRAAVSEEDMDAEGDVEGEGFDNTLKYDAADANEEAQKNEQLQQSTQSQLIWIASISLLVGGIGVMNIMLVSVTERTREIGLKKAIGARKRRIMLQFLTEAAVLTSLGGIVGVLGGIAMAEVIQRVNHIPISISVPWIIISLVFSTLIGVVFGFLPAVQASNLDPIVALRYE
jgi:putative ABC transport system permease protein